MHIRDIVRSVSMYYSACIAGVLSASLVLASSACMNASAAWFDDPSVKASVDIGTGTDPHYINLSEDGAYLMVDTHASNTAFPVQVYSVAELKALSGEVKDKDVAMASALAGDFFGAGSGTGGWKGGAISAKLGLMIPGSGKESGALYTAFDVPAFGWKAGENAFQIGGLDGAGFDGLDFNAAGTRLYVNQYASGNRNKILAYDTASLKSAHLLSLLSTKTVEGVSRIRNLSCYAIGGKDLVYFGEGAVSGSNNSVYVYDPAEDTVTTLVTDAALFDDDIMNVKLSHIATGCPTMYVQTDNGRLHVFQLAADGKSVTSAKPVKSFTAAECATLCGLSAVPSSPKFRNFEVTDDGETAFFLFHNSNGTNSPGLCVVKADAYVASTGAQAINTGYRVNSRTRIEIDFKVDEVVKLTEIFGASGSSGTTCCLWINGSSNLEPNFGGWCGAIENPAKAERRTVVFDLPGRSVKIYAHGGTTPLNTKGSDKVFDKGEADRPLALFANCNDANGSAMENFGTCRIYSFKVWEEGADPIHDWQPAMKGGEVGFVDKVDGSFISEHRLGATPLAIGGDYETLEDDPYIESDGTSVINTGILPDTDLRMELDYALTTTEQNDVRVSGNNETGVQTIELYVSKDGTKMNFCIGKGWPGGISMGGLDTRRHTFVADIPNGKAHMISGSTTVGTWNLNTTSPIDAKGTIPIALFGRINNANGASDWAGGRAKARIYGAKFYKAGTLVHDFVPCVKGDVPGFRDTVGGTFHTGEFNVQGLSASDNVVRIPDDGYIELVGNNDTVGGHYIDTGYKPGPETRLELDYAISSNLVGHTDWYMLGAGVIQNGNAMAHYASKTTLGNCLGKTSSWVGTGMPAPTNTAFARRTIILDAPNMAATLVTAGYVNYASTNNSGFAAFTGNTSSTLKIGSTQSGNGGYTPMRIYGLKIYESGSLVRDYVPYVNNGQPGLRYGTTFTAFSRNSAITAVGEVIVGGTVATSSPDDGDAYAESFGASAINTRYFPNSATKIELDYQVMLSKKSSTVAGTIDGSGTTFCLWVNGNGNLEPNLGGWCGGWGANGVGAATTHRRTAVFDVPTRSAALYEHGGTTPIATKDSTKINDNGTGNRPVALFAMCKSTDGATMENYGHVRIYRFKVWENDVLVRDFVPCVAPDGTPCMFDAVEKDAFPATGLKVSGRGHNGAEEWIIKPQNVNLTKSKGSTTLKAVAIGAQSYKWTKNGEPVSGDENDSVEVEWTKGGATDIYSVTAVYDVFGEEFEGTPVQVSVANEPPGMVIILR